MENLILASGSPRRAEVLRVFLGSRLEVVPSAYQEDNSAKGDPIEIALRHALGKAQEVSGRRSGVIVGIDTFVICDGVILGKPSGIDNNLEMLRSQSGKDITVVSGIAVISGSVVRTAAEKTICSIAELDDEEILSYVRTGDGLDKAGGFGVQGKGSVFVRSIHGCFWNVVGIPIYRLNCMLGEVGFYLLPKSI